MNDSHPRNICVSFGCCCRAPDDGVVWYWFCLQAVVAAMTDLARLIIHRALAPNKMCSHQSDGTAVIHEKHSGTWYIMDLALFYTTMVLEDRAPKSRNQFRIAASRMRFLLFLCVSFFLVWSASEWSLHH